MGQIIGSAAKPKRCNLNRLSQMGTPAAGEHILVSSDNSMNAAGQGNFDCYIVGDGITAASSLELHYFDAALIEDEEVIVRALQSQNDRITELENLDVNSFTEDDEYVIAKSLNDLNRRVDNNSASGDGITETLTIANSDKIAILGDSTSSCHYNFKGKDWVSKVSLFSDYLFFNHSTSGDTCAGQANRIRNNSGVMGAPLKSYKPTYGVVNCWINDMSSLTMPQFIVSLDNLCKTLETLGCEPIIMGEIDGRVAPNNTYVNSIREYAESRGYLFFDTKTAMTPVYPQTAYQQFWVGGHPKTRTNALIEFGFAECLQAMERPMKSLKVFRVRNSVNTSDLDNMMFKDNIGRAERFKEIYTGYGITNPAYIDNNGNNTIDSTTPEYVDLLNKTAVAFTDYALISAVLPATAKHIKSLNVSIKSNSTLTTYVRNGLASPYPSVQSYMRFTCPNITTLPDVGDVYSVSGESGNLTIADITQNGNNEYLLWCTPDSTAADVSGSLVRVSGSGDSTIAFTSRESATMAASSVMTDTCGHWSEVTNTNNAFSIAVGTLFQCMVGDTLHILVEKSGSFTISDIQINYTYDEQKNVHRKVVSFDSNYYSSKTEILPSSTFGTALQTDSNWNVTPQLCYEQRVNYFAVPTTSVVAVGDVYTRAEDGLDYVVQHSGIIGSYLYIWAECQGNYMARSSSRSGTLTKKSGDSGSDVTISYSDNMNGYNDVPTGTNTSVVVTNNTTLSYTIPDNDIEDGKDAVLEIWCRYFPAVNSITADSYDYNYIVACIGSGSYKAELNRKVGLFWQVVRYNVKLYKTGSGLPIEIKSNSKGIEVVYVSFKK